jgi:ribosomal-protein-alanine N-acetyltransferase
VGERSATRHSAPINRATRFHAPVLAAIHAAAFTGNPWTVAAFTNLLTQPNVTGLMHEAGGLILIRTAADEAEILTIAAHPPRQGTGRALLTAAIAHTKAAGTKNLFLEVATTNTAAIALYASAGFTEAGRRPRYYENGADALIMRLTL